MKNYIIFSHHCWLKSLRCRIDPQLIFSLFPSSHYRHQSLIAADDLAWLSLDLKWNLAADSSIVHDSLSVCLGPIWRSSKTMHCRAWFFIVIVIDAHNLFRCARYNETRARSTIKATLQIFVRRLSLPPHSVRSWVCVADQHYIFLAKLRIVPWAA